MVIVDAGRMRKLPHLIRDLVGNAMLPADGTPESAGSIPLVIATHPHVDHIAGIPEILNNFPDRTAEIWEPGYFHTVADYHDMMTAIEAQPTLLYAQPTSGLRRWIGNVSLTVLGPSIDLRNRFDTYGTEINDSSLTIRLEYPASRVVQRGNHRELITGGRSNVLVLGADAQTLSWSYVLTEFPQLHTSGSAAARAIRAATGSDTLRGHVLKVSHHASKRGLNLELIERIDAALTLVSSVRGGGRHRFPHTVAQEMIREAMEPIASNDRARSPDHQRR